MANQKGLLAETFLSLVTDSLLSLRSGLGNDDLATIEFGTIELGDGLIGFLIGRHLDETETLRAAGHPVHDNGRRNDGTTLLKMSLKGLVGRTPGNTAYEKSF